MSLFEPPSPWGQALLTLKTVVFCSVRYSSVRLQRTYARIAANNFHAASVLSVGFALFVAILAMFHHTPVSFADGEQEKISFVLGTYMYPDTHDLIQASGLSTVAIKGENVGGAEADSDQANTGSAQQHIVVSGETLGGIAQEYGLSSKDFMVANPSLSSPDAIYPGQVLTIPANAATPDQIASIKATQQIKKSSKAVADTVIYPLHPEYISQYFGENKAMYGGIGHTGWDLVTHIGTPVHAATDGVITFAETGWNGGYGTDIILKDSHSNKSTLYGHLSRLLAHEGEVVSQGDEIALSGDTGNSTGPHLHFEVRINGQPVNPMPYLP